MMKKNIDEATSWGSARNRPKEPGEGSRNPGRRRLPSQRQSENPANRSRARAGGTEESRQGQRGPQSKWDAENPPPSRIQSNGGGITYTSKPKESSTTEPETKPETKPKAPKYTQTELDTILKSLPAKRRKKLGIPTGGPIQFTGKTGKPLKPGGKAANEKIKTARRGGSPTRLARGITRTRIIKEFIENYRKSILK